MDPMKRVLGVGVAGFLLTAFLPCQAQEADLPRGKALGEVRNKDGKPWVGAKVCLVSWPVPDNFRIGRPDRVETRADERGRFRARILEGRSYTVWAQGEQGAGGTLRLSNVQTDVVPQVPVLLEEQEQAARGSGIRITGLEEWAEYKPLRLRLVDANGPRELALEIGEDGRCRLPPRIGGSTLEVLATGPHGILLVQKKALHDGVVELGLPPPVKVGFAVWDIDTEKPVEGARIYPKEADSTSLLGVTGKDGFAEVVIPDSDRQNWGRFIAVARGRAVAPCQHGESKNAVFQKAHADKKVHYHAHMGQGHDVEGRVLLRPDTPASGLTLLVQGSAMHYTKKNSRSLADFAELLHTDSAGRFRLGSLLKEYPPDLTMVLAPEHIAALPAAWREGLSPVVFAPIDLSQVMTRDGAHRNILVTELCPVELVVRTAMGVPAALAHVQLTALNNNIGNREKCPGLLADRRGRVRLLLPRAARLGLSIDTGEGFLLTCLETRAAAGDQSIARLEVKLPKPVAIRGRVVDSLARGVAGVSLRATPQWQGRMPRLVAETAGGESPFPDGRNAVRLANLEQMPNSHGLFFALVGRRMASTDKDGRFTLGVPRMSLQYRLHAYVQQAGAYRHGNAQVDVDSKEGAGDVEVVLR